MCCQTNIPRHPSRQSPCDCGCSDFPRRFLSAQEKKEGLEEYQKQLEKELAAVKECIKEVEKG